MIKKCGKIFLLGIIFITIIIVSFTMLAKIQLEQFNKAYIKEEKEEISALAKQVSWAVKPILKSKNYEELAEYCDLFKDSDTRITINDNKDKPVIGKKITNNFQTEGTFVDSQYVYYVMHMKIDNLDYTLIIYTATKHMNITLHKSGRYILLSILAGAFIVISLAVYLLGTYKSFNRLQDCAVKISEGDLDTNIFIPRGGILFELSYALDKMAKR